MQVLILRPDGLPVMPTLRPALGTTELGYLGICQTCSALGQSVWGPSCTSSDHPLVQALVRGLVLTPHPHQTCFLLSPAALSFPGLPLPPPPPSQGPGR